jgi:hypothetical protein
VIFKERTMAETKNSSGSASTSSAPPPTESLVQDARAGLTPSQLVERKLATLLRSTPLPVSQMQNTARRRALS